MCKTMIDGADLVMPKTQKENDFIKGVNNFTESHMSIQIFGLEGQTRTKTVCGGGWMVQSYHTACKMPTGILESQTIGEGSSIAWLNGSEVEKPKGETRLASFGTIQIAALRNSLSVLLIQDLTVLRTGRNTEVTATTCQAC